MPHSVPRVAKSSKPLTAQKLQFVDFFVGEAAGNGAKAAELSGWSKTSAKVIASRLLKDPRIKAAIVHRQGVLVNQALTATDVVNSRVMTGEEALERLTVFARADIGCVLDPEDPIAKLPADVRATVKSITPNRYGRRIELHDSMRATELLAKAGGKLKDIVQVESLEALIAKSMQPVPAGAAA